MTRRNLSSAENYHLWMVSGGICTFEGCNERLVVNTKGKLTNSGIKAHIIGHKKGAARHEYAEEFEYSDGNLEDISNLMLMCYTHSKLIDDPHTRDSFPPTLLFDMKSKHEEWVRSWTDEKKKSLAIVHKRLGPPLTTLPLTEHSPNIMLEAIESQVEFTNFSPDGWEQGKADNEKLYAKFVTRINKGKYDVAEVYAISPIPLLIHLGKLISDTVPLTVYQYDREGGFWVNKAPDKALLEDLKPTTSFTDKDSNELVVTISVSDTITDEDVHAILGENQDRYDILIENPHVKRLLYFEQVQQIQKLFKDNVEAFHRQKKYKLIHLLYSGPAGLAIELGRSINENMWPEVVVYEFKYRGAPRYQKALNI
ncbi:SAVED domain-containing protein [Paenibacillus taichungensis]|uniref:SAVED domain-containing protein n=1 Tax=Paenibacillus taichungensis TaxID=484184 RepID=A0ABX2ML49_9BACL|nr:SAVED domain-containing protein [Paenibacillus taichungensis]NUU54776.1 SAVED domain-containing protein [Paenibacillus taichungensis]